MTMTANRPFRSTDLGVIRTLQVPLGATLAALSDDYRYIWTRDVCQKAIALWQMGEHELTKELLHGLLVIHHNHAWKIGYILKEGKPSPGELWKVLHPSFKPEGHERSESWSWLQNDGIGLFLFSLGMVEREQPGFLSDKDVELIQQLVKYLHAVRCWEPDSSTWEEIIHLNAVSLQSCLEGVQAVQGLVPVPDQIIERCTSAYLSLEGWHSWERPVDFSHLQLFYPLAVSADTQVLQRIEAILLRERGLIRYPQDWFQGLIADGRVEREAEWPLGLYWLGLAWLHCGNREKAHAYLDYANRLRTPKGELTEAYVPVRNERGTWYTSSTHTPLGWTHAFAAVLEHGLGLPA